MSQELYEFDIDDASHVLEHLETLKGNELYGYGLLNIIVEKDFDKVVDVDKIISTYKEIKSSFIDPSLASSTIAIITFTNNASHGRDYVWSTTDFEPFNRIRRITGYLVGTLDRFNNGKRAEEKERVKHTL